MSTRAVFLGSPLLGGVSFEPLIDELTALGWECRTASLPPSPVTPDSVIESYVGEIEMSQPDVLVAHSNAGYYTPVIARQTGGRTIMFMDAALPLTEGTTSLSPPRFRDFLASLPLTGGLLPRWSEWWPAEAVAELIPDPMWRERVLAAQPRLGFEYFTAEIEVPEKWALGPCAYIGFGDTYADEMAFAMDHGWPVARLEGRHLHHLLAPAEVARALVELWSDLDKD